MNIFKHFSAAFVQWFKNVGSFPQAMAASNGERRRQLALAELEAERLDRIRNPSKYLGK